MLSSKCRDHSAAGVSRSDASVFRVIPLEFDIRVGTATLTALGLEMHSSKLVLQMARRDSCAAEQRLAAIPEEPVIVRASDDVGQCYQEETPPDPRLVRRGWLESHRLTPSIHVDARRLRVTISVAGRLCTVLELDLAQGLCPRREPECIPLTYACTARAMFRNVRLPSCA